MQKLIQKIRTTEERDALDAELDTLLKSLFENRGAGLESSLKSQVRYWVGEMLREGMPEEIESIKDYLETIKEDLRKLKVLKMTIAFEPTDSSIDKFSDFIRKNIAENVIIDLEIDPKIYGGAEITYGGEFRDFSLKRLFENEYKEKENELKQIIAKK